MQNKEWTFLSNHGKILVYLAKYQKNTAQVIAQEVGLSIRAVQQIIDDLERDGYLHRRKVGRCNHYIIHSGKAMRKHLETEYAVGKVLQAIGCQPGNGKSGLKEARRKLKQPVLQE
jgi:predicted ArsR family transcriptional regulator